MDPPAWHGQSKVGVGRDFLVWFWNAYPEKEVTNAFFPTHIPITVLEEEKKG